MPFLRTACKIRKMTNAVVRKQHIGPKEMESVLVCAGCAFIVQFPLTFVFTLIASGYAASNTEMTGLGAVHMEATCRGSQPISCMQYSEKDGVN